MKGGFWSLIGRQIDFMVYVYLIFDSGIENGRRPYHYTALNPGAEDSTKVGYLCRFENRNVPGRQYRYVLSKRKIHSVLTCLGRFKVPGIRASPLGTIGGRDARSPDRGFEKYGWFRHDALTTYVENHPVARQTYSELITEDNRDALRRKILDAAAVFDADGNSINTMDYLTDDFQLGPGMEVHFYKFKAQRRKKYLDAVAMDFQHHFERSMDDATFDVHELRQRVEGS